MTRRWWGGPGISVVLHAAVLMMLIHAAGRSGRVEATTAPVSGRTTFTVEVTSGDGTIGHNVTGGATPRRGDLPASRPLDVTPPRTIERVEPLPIGSVSTTRPLEVVMGAPAAVDGTAIGLGPGPWPGRRGPGTGPGAGPGGGDVYEAGIGGVSSPTLIREVKPNFTIDAMRARIEGVVDLEIVVRADGSVDPEAIRITRSLDRGLDREAVIAVRQWRFRPSMRLGQPVASRAFVELAFTLR